jgi:hypothetical protein
LTDQYFLDRRGDLAAVRRQLSSYYVFKAATGKEVEFRDRFLPAINHEKKGGYDVVERNGKRQIR